MCHIPHSITYTFHIYTKGQEIIESTAYVFHQSRVIVRWFWVVRLLYIYFLLW